MRQVINACHSSKAPMYSILPRPTDTLLFYPIFPLRGCLDTTSSVRLQWEAPITCQTLRKDGGNGKELCCSACAPTSVLPTMTTLRTPVAEAERPLRRTQCHSAACDTGAYRGIQGASLSSRACPRGGDGGGQGNRCCQTGHMTHAHAREQNGRDLNSKHSVQYSAQYLETGTEHCQSFVHCAWWRCGPTDGTERMDGSVGQTGP